MKKNVATAGCMIDFKANFLQGSNDLPRFKDRQFSHDI